MMQFSTVLAAQESFSTSHPARYLDGLEKGKYKVSSSDGSGVYRFPKSNVSEIEERLRMNNYDGQGKSKEQETYDSMVMLSYTLIYMAVVVVACAVGLFIWLW